MKGYVVPGRFACLVKLNVGLNVVPCSFHVIHPITNASVLHASILGPYAVVTAKTSRPMWTTVVHVGIHAMQVFHALMGNAVVNPVRNYVMACALILNLIIQIAATAMLHVQLVTCAFLVNAPH